MFVFTTHFCKKRLKKKENSPSSFIIKITDNTKSFLPLNDPITLKVSEKTEHVAVTELVMSSHIFGFGNDTIWIALFKVGYYIRVQQMNSIQLIPQSYPKKKRKTRGKVNENKQETILQTSHLNYLPVWLDVMRPPKQFNLPCARRQTLNHSIDLIRFVTGRAHLKTQNM